MVSGVLAVRFLSGANLCKQFCLALMAALSNSWGWAGVCIPLVMSVSNLSALLVSVDQSRRNQCSLYCPIEVQKTFFQSFSFPLLMSFPFFPLLMCPYSWAWPLASLICRACNPAGGGWARLPVRGYAWLLQISSVQFLDVQSPACRTCNRLRPELLTSVLGQVPQSL